ncbi:MAG: putative zinc-binding dehydrogenase [Actinomycetia bacterium]|nr:putative zinc-binding dehydrogenase [Actinomycetes bacterium]
MKQVVQPVSGGPVTLLDVPRPVPEATEVLVRTVSSVISPGTERALTSLAQANLLAKARARPDLVRQVVKKARAEGLAATRQAVAGRLAQDIPLGYSAAGIVVSVGSAVTGVRPGQLVATGGAGHANHAEFQAVPGLLCAPASPDVSPQDAAFTTIAAIALHGLRLAEAGPGSKVVIVGLGLIGQLAARLAIAAGCDVAGIDPAPYPRTVAAGSGVLALDERGAETTEQVLAWSRGRGADAVLVCAAGASPAAVMRVPELCRDRAPVVIVGDVGLQLRRTPFYERELSLRFARSYGPGRYDPSYEAWGVDYPAGQVRWTEGRNFEAVLDLLAAGRLTVTDLVTHSFDITAATQAYKLIEERQEPYLAIRLEYPDRAGTADSGGPVQVRPMTAKGDVGRTGPAEPGIGLIGAGAFATGTLLPALRAARLGKLVTVGSAGGLSATRAAQRHGFAKAAAGAEEVLADPDVTTVVIATPHDTHAAFASSALRSGRHVWCEKPVALTEDELDEVQAAWRESGRVLAIGLNRRWSPAVIAARRMLSVTAAPKLVIYRVAAGPVPDGHWYHDPRQGGRLLGEVCHFVDTAQALVGAPIEDVTGLSGGGPRGPGDDAVVALRFADGSLATIGYGSAAPTAGKEWIEIHAGSHRVVIDDFRSCVADGRKLWKGNQDKGHQALAVAFRQALLAAGGAGGASGAHLPTEDMLATTRATIRAASSAALGGGARG